MTEHSVLAGGGEMGALMRSMDWSKTALGPVEAWPQSLRTTVSTCLSSRFPILVWWGPEFVKIYNDAYRPMLGNKHPRSMGQRGYECWPEIWHIIGPMLARVMERGEATWSEDQFLPLERHGFAEECYFTYSYSPIRDESAGIGGVFCAVTETTRRVLGERRLRTLRDLAARTAQASDAEEACRVAADVLCDNKNDLPFFALYLIDREAEPLLAAASFPDVDASEVELALAQALAKAIRTGTPAKVEAPSALVIPFGRSSEGRPLGVLACGISSNLWFDEEYRGFLELVAGHLATAIAGLRARQAAEERADMLAELDRAKTAFFSNVSHEFRTPLTLMVGPLEDMLGSVHGDLAPAAREQLELAYRNALRLLKLVNTLLDFARIEAGRMQAVYEPVDLARITTEAAGTFRSAIERAGLRLFVDCQLHRRVFVDVEMWDKIVLNLLSNALKFTFEGDITVGLRAHDDVAVLEVTDTGTGIAEEDIPNLFKRFHRIHAARSRTHEGSGIGLALVQDLVGLHGGTIACKSEPGRGTTFRVAIPFGCAHLPSERIQAQRDQASTATRAEVFVAEALRWVGADAPVATSTAHARVLVADDNADMRDYLQRILGAHWQVETVADGASALEAARRDPPALVLSDVMMPGLDGFALLAELKRDERTRHVPVVMLSARAGEESRVEGLAAGADDYLVKPFSARELVARVGSQINLSRARREADLQRENLHALFMQAPTPICILRGYDHIVELANASCCEVWGKKPEDLVGSTLFEVLPELESQAFKGFLRDVLTTGTPYVGKEVPARLGSDGTQRDVYFNFVYAPLRDADNRVDGVLVLAFEVTDEVHARDELTRTVQANELFAGVLGHDLRNPLAAIMYAAELLLAQSADDAVTLPAKRILTSGRRISRMIDQLLDFTRMRLGGGLRLLPGETDLEEIVKRVVAEVEDARERKFRVVTLGKPVGLWDPDRMAQVVSNLAANAAQHSADGDIEVRIDARASDEVTLSFVNDGAFPAELLPKLFEPFQGGRKKQMHSTGLGLGLYITKEIIAAHGGRVSAASTADGRAEITVVIPRAAVDRASPAPKVELGRPFT
ncbi:MAG TPA: ATP-binding protein [Polyangiaceae bacterium]|nr:ATP-binding protein [Polyangiaceae bacterium]